MCPQKKEDVRTCVQKINGDDSSNKDNTIANSNINNDDNDINSNEKKDKDINDSNKNYNDNDTNVNDNKDGNNNDDSDNSNKESNNDNDNENSTTNNNDININNDNETNNETEKIVTGNENEKINNNDNNSNNNNNITIIDNKLKVSEIEIETKQEIDNNDNLDPKLHNFKNIMYTLNKLNEDEKKKKNGENFNFLGRVRTVGRDCRLFSQGMGRNYLYVILQGECSLRRECKNVPHGHSSGHFFFEFCLFLFHFCFCVQFQLFSSFIQLIHF